MPTWILTFIVTLVVTIVPVQAVAREQLSRMQVDQEHVRTWNRFADSVVTLHRHIVSMHPVRTTEEDGGYGGLTGPRDFYHEVRYYDRENDRLLGWIQWEKDQPDTIHAIEVYIHDEEGRVARDYLAAYLPGFRNAPIQTLVNLHAYNGELHAFRQFDASGDRIYEQCSGRHFDSIVDISLEDYQLPPLVATRPAVMSSEAYIACFGELPANAGEYLDPLHDMETGSGTAATGASLSRDVVDEQIAEYTRALSEDPKQPELLVLRGDAYFLLHEFDRTIEDYTLALGIDNSLDEAYFGRGMAHGRRGDLVATGGLEPPTSAL